ncbi:riboflavin biosynthesis protein [Thalassotalea insulae]|uniref:Riboflavin biosynthesis protein n=1 Tax=Thalassotalea insulae TaxID=2056778 RepID=A0ABQ6GPS9_9GAMM|nr:bifunctional riboflavin kinase/FAD synthetase [Thalassotalea insulae]GLX77169.1 riboflavin biosynthesis protein [Thalassotalea insulae]
MQLIRGIHNIQSNQALNDGRGCVLTIGNFDGVHLGHQRVIKALVKKAQELNSVATVMVFEPQPRELFTPQTAPARLTRLRDKYVLLKQLGVERLICVNFNRKFANICANEFVEHLLVQSLKIKYLIIGDDFHFGKNRQGNFSTLQAASKQFNFGISDTASCKLDNCRISSTAIRTALAHNMLDDATQMLGRPYSIIGRVFHGDKRGRQLGFPTANVLLKRRVSPVSGVYVVEVKTGNGNFYGVTNIGSRPTFFGVRQQLEVHLFNFDCDIYGQLIEVILLKKLREEQKFASLAELTEQIKADSEQAQQYLRALASN